MYYINAYRLRESCAQICYRYIRSNLHDGIRMNWSAYERIPLKSCVTCDDVWWWRQQQQQQQNPSCSLFVAVCMRAFRGKCNVVTVNHVRWHNTHTHKLTQTQTSTWTWAWTRTRSIVPKDRVPKCVLRMVSDITHKRTLCKWIYFVRCFVAENFQKLCLFVNMRACMSLRAKLWNDIKNRNDLLNLRAHKSLLSILILSFDSMRQKYLFCPFCHSLGGMLSASELCARWLPAICGGGFVIDQEL